MTSPATTLALESAELARRLSLGLVAIRSEAGGGSGTSWTADGLIVTNHHVAATDRVEVTLADDARHTGRVVARDEANDLALVRVESALTPLDHGDSRTLRPGHLVFAIGNPWGQRGTPTRGVVLTRGASGLETDAPVRDVIRADIRLAPGNSGGPLVDASGCVVGINSMVVGGMGVAIPVHTVQAFIASHQDIEPGVLGVTLLPVAIPGAIAASYSLEPEALMLTEIEPGSPADKAGLMPGDLLVGIGDVRGGARDIARSLRRIHAGRPVDLSILRGGSLVSTRATPSFRS